MMKTKSYCVAAIQIVLYIFSVSTVLRGQEHSAAASPDYIIAISENCINTKVSDYILGLNSTTYTGDYLNDSTLLSYLKEFAPQLIRFPGGDASNMYFFNGLPEDLPESALTFDGEWTDFMDGTKNENWRMNTNKYYTLLEEIGAKGFITVNYPYARYGLSENPVATAASLAADWVRYDNGRTNFWEIGNETYACWEGGFRIDTSSNIDGQPEYVNGTLYGQHLKVFADSMRAAAKEIGSNIYIGAVFADSDDIWDGSGKGITKSWNTKLAEELRLDDGSNYADFISVHSYFLNKGETTPFEILSTQHVSEEIKNYVYRNLNEAGVEKVPSALTEWNIKEPHQTTHIGGMQSVAAICSMIENGFEAAMYFAIKDYWRKESGDFGMFSHHDPDHPNSNPYPSYYHQYFLNKVLGETILEIEASPQDDSIFCFASNSHHGEIGIVLINKSEESKQVRIDVNSIKADKEYLWYHIKGGDEKNVWTESVVINGNTNAKKIKGGPDIPGSIPPWKGSGSEYIDITIDGLSAVYLLIGPSFD
jgi:hypothetical protein